MSIKSNWIALLYKSATGTKKVRTLLTPVGLIVFGLFLALTIFISIKADQLFAIGWFIPNFPTYFSGLAILFLGVWLVTWSVIHFFKEKGTPVPLNPPPKLVTGGPYQYVRNPMISGIFFLLFGLGFLIKSPALVFVFTPLFIVLNLFELKTIEEPELQLRLGKEYEIYKKGTPMFLPKILKRWKR